MPTTIKKFDVPTARGIMYRSSKPLCANVNMNNNTLRLACQTSVAICHRKCHHFVGACYDLWKLSLLLNLTFNYSFNDRGMICRFVNMIYRRQTGQPCIPDPKLTKQCVTPAWIQCSALLGTKAKQARAHLPQSFKKRKRSLGEVSISRK